jgi:hypothetical protein
MQKPAIPRLLQSFAQWKARTDAEAERLGGHFLDEMSFRLANQAPVTDDYEVWPVLDIETRGIVVDGRTGWRLVLKLSDAGVAKFWASEPQTWPNLEPADFVAAEFHGAGKAFDAWMGLPEGTTRDNHRNAVILDFDGPMIPDTARVLRGNRAADRRRPMRVFSPIAAGLVAKLLKEAHADLVVSSSWALKGRRAVKRLLERNGIPPSSLHQDWATPRKMTSRRVSEIEWWLRDHPEVTRYAAIDDDPGVAELKGAVVTDKFDGFLSDHYLAAAALLGIPERRVLLP